MNRSVPWTRRFVAAAAAALSLAACAGGESHLATGGFACDEVPVDAPADCLGDFGHAWNLGDALVCCNGSAVEREVLVAAARQSGHDVAPGADLVLVCSHACHGDGDCAEGDLCALGPLGCRSCVTPATACGAEGACDDGDACTIDTCDADGVCRHEPAPACDDGDACTDDYCDPTSGCEAVTVTCDDGDACTEDACDPTNGCSASSIDCDDDDACTLDRCEAAIGCTSRSIDCDDGDACTIDTCEPLVGCLARKDRCGDDDPCTTDTCDPMRGCVFEPVEGCARCVQGTARCVDGGREVCRDDGEGWEPHPEPCGEGTACLASGRCFAVAERTVAGAVGHELQSAPRLTYGPPGRGGALVWIGRTEPGGAGGQVRVQALTDDGEVDPDIPRLDGIDNHGDPDSVKSASHAAVDAAMDADGALMVVWEAEIAVGENDGATLGRVRRADGAWASPVKLGEFSDGRQQRPRVVASTDGGFLTAWDTQLDGLFRVSVRSFAADGAPTSFERTFDEQAGAQTHLTSAAPRPDGGALLAAIRTGQAGGAPHAAVAVASADGAPVGSWIVLPSQPGDDFGPARCLAGDGPDDILCVAHRERDALSELVVGAFELGATSAAEGEPASGAWRAVDGPWAMSAETTAPVDLWRRGRQLGVAWEHPRTASGVIVATYAEGELLDAASEAPAFTPATTRFAGSTRVIACHPLAAGPLLCAWEQHDGGQRRLSLRTLP